jgi:hypothetical protein
MAASMLLLASAALAECLNPICTAAYGWLATSNASSKLVAVSAHQLAAIMLSVDPS